jgi:cysteinyl-tRNA synthetase
MSEHEEKMGQDEKLNAFELQLANAMKRVDAPKTLGDSVMLAIAQEQRATASVAAAPSLLMRLFAFLEFPSWVMGAVAAALVVGALIAGQVHEKRQHQLIEARQRVEADREFETADRITDRALDHVREQLAKAGVRPED